MLSNRPDVYKLVGFVGDDTHSAKFADLLPVLRAVFSVYGTDSGDGDSIAASVTADDCRDMLMLPVLSEDDVLAMDALWGEAATSIFHVRARDRTQRFTWDQFFGKLNSERIGTSLLVELQRQVLAYQVRIKGLLVLIAQSHGKRKAP
jgi:hypothetical protein